jgi:hypothetical protein
MSETTPSPVEPPNQDAGPLDGRDFLTGQIRAKDGAPVLIGAGFEGRDLVDGKIVERVFHPIWALNGDRLNTLAASVIAYSYPRILGKITDLPVFLSLAERT